jgi:DNA polymerase III subunit epsilon
VPDRQIVVVDVETTGLDPDRHLVVEVAWWNLTTEARGSFVPPHSWRDAVTEADLEALRVNRYFDRLAEAEQDTNGKAAGELWDQLDGNTLAGSNPAFDAAFLRAMFSDAYDLDDHGIDEAPRWHHRLLDLSAYAAGVLGLPPEALPGLSTVCELLGVTNPAPHTADGDVIATALCFQGLFDRQAVGRA